MSEKQLKQMSDIFSLTDSELKVKLGELYGDDIIKYNIDLLSDHLTIKRTIINEQPSEIIVKCVCGIKIGINGVFILDEYLDENIEYLDDTLCDLHNSINNITSETPCCFCGKTNNSKRNIDGYAYCLVECRDYLK